MSKSIAVFLSKDEETISFDKAGTINVYVKEKDNWYIMKEIPFNTSDVKALKEIRQRFIQLGKDLENCKVLVAQQISGIPYNVLDTMGFNLWELEGRPKEFLEYVLENEENADNKEDMESAEINSGTDPIIHKKDGYFYINLKELQESNSGISSKQALLPFLRSNDFYELEIICSHIPPWFEHEFEKLKLRADSIKKEANEYKVIVCHKTCSE